MIVNEAELAAVVRRVEQLFEEAPVGAVVTVLADGSVVSDGPTEVREEWAWPEDRLVSFVVTHRLPSARVIQRRIEQALRKRQC